ncbi:MAG TPA: hypothetical protein VMW47_11685 [Verrucomicrobiae bacterium]|nr:hypothetical protein [Verrucomicrobiae bacterium]
MTIHATVVPTELGPRATARTDGTAISEANRQIRQGFAAHAEWAIGRVHRRQWVQAIDRALDRLEKLHLEDVVGGPTYCRELVKDIVGAVPAEPPSAVRSARTSFHLHAALLTWQETALEGASPNRRSYPDTGPEIAILGNPGHRRHVRALRPSPRLRSR